MQSLKILVSPQLRFFSGIHPFHRWKKQLSESGVDVQVYYDHKKIPLNSTDCLIVNHKYFHHMWNAKKLDANENEEEWIQYLRQTKERVGKLIWWCSQDTTCSTGFGVIPYVDVFLKNQVLKDKSYYLGDLNEEKNLRVWLNPTIEQRLFKTCAANQVDKIKVGWNLGYFDYRYLPYKLNSYLSNFVPYNLRGLSYTKVDSDRSIDLTFRGKMNYDNQFSNKRAISLQRNAVISLLGHLPFKIASGNVVAKKQYWKELRSAKICISPFGYGEVCYRDFESFISGAILLKPSMDHLETFVDVYIPNKTYIPLRWDMEDLEEKIHETLNNYNEYKDIAINGQDLFQKVGNDPQVFISAIKDIIK